ncbi:MAG: DUF5107 domain-containing protein, partial [Clostridia bacterium]|nr:DUF5107 domain-containing protein [Clostridia bacterium]
VMDHGKRGVSTFPIATGTNYKVDYSKGVDISRYDNLPVPTSYMAAKSDFDFVGGYDEDVNAGLLHIADHHISPGKKQWTWGSGDFGKAWDRNLTDDDGPYFELMTGCFTDNQPDFSFIAPFENRNFTQYFMPYHDLGQVHNANKDLSIHLDVDEYITVLFYCSGTLDKCDVNVNKFYKKTFDFKCAETYELKIPNGNNLKFKDIKITVKKNGKEILSFDGNFKKQEIPEAAKEAPLPKECKTNEDLYLYGRHIEQYRHATRRAEDYYLEGLRRDPTDMRLNNAYGMLLFKKGCIEESEKYFRNAIEKQTRSNPNPNSGEYYYNLGLSLFYQNKLDEAFDAFYKAVWNADTQSNAYFFMAQIKSRQGDKCSALEYVESALIYNARNFGAMNLKALLKGSKSEAVYYDSLNILALFINGEDISKHIVNPNMLIDLSLELWMSGYSDKALELLNICGEPFPLLDYYRAFYSADNFYLEKAFKASPYCCFPNRIEDIAVLENAIANNPEDFKAPYYLGCLYYDKERHNDAAECFERSITRGADFATPFRNLALLKYNVWRNAEEAFALMQKAYSLDESDARILYEFDLLKKRMGVQPKERLAFLESRLDIIQARDDLTLEYITLLNLTGEYKKALDMIKGRKFHPWEGGEGKVPEQFIFCNIALNTPENTFTYPENLGEGKLYGAQENRQNYYMGLKTGNNAFFEKASKGLSEPTSATYYNDQPPEMIFYQGMALKKLGRTDDANERFDKLIAYADSHIDDEIVIDYFAVSLPDLLVFDEDLNLKNRLHCMFMKALGLFGKGEKEKSKKLFEKALAKNPNAFQIATHYDLFFKENIK